jgi:hypothetical protein
MCFVASKIILLRIGSVDHVTCTIHCVTYLSPKAPDFHECCALTKKGPDEMTPACVKTLNS